MKEVILYEETWIFIDDSVHSDSRFVGWMRGRGRTVSFARLSYDDRTPRIAVK